LFGAISVSGAASQLSEADLGTFAKKVSAAAKRASRALGGSFAHRLGP
jgi:DNA-binding IclR family transcriptional regulator